MERGGHVPMAETNGRCDVRRFSGSSGAFEAAVPAPPHGDSEGERGGYLPEDLPFVDGVREEGEGQERPDTEGQRSGQRHTVGRAGQRPEEGLVLPGAILSSHATASPSGLPSGT